MRAPILLFLSIFGLVGIAGACGGGVEVGPGPGDGGSSSSSSSGASGSSSGASGSSSGASSGGSGTSSGGPSCAPLPGCNSSTECPLPGGCGGTCFCENGGWECTGGGCGDDVSDAYPGDDGPYGECPLDPPDPGQLCAPSGLECGYGAAEGCGESCFCENGSWACTGNPCPPPVCDGVPPPNGSLCESVGSSCFYPTNNACGGEEECDCDPSGNWSCYELGCFDGGGPDLGPPDTGTGTFDSGSPCPASLPGASSACSTEGIVCSYFEGCEYNCLCASSGWVCAPEGPCASPPPPGGG
jgi:hypothetical protein